MQRFEGKTVIVTGGGGGIGGATCRRFGKDGAHVAVLDLNVEAAEKVAAAIRSEGFYVFVPRNPGRRLLSRGQRHDGENTSQHSRGSKTRRESMPST